MTKRIYGRSQSLARKHENDSATYLSVFESALTLRTRENRPENEDAIRGVF